ncbi:MAG TPA: glycosyltransferase family 39 protein [Nocardioides sp.]|nr:glycosyltransferase family 39 protein [Nocardioides sp.]
MSTTMTTSETATGPSRWRRVDPLGPLLAVAALVVFLVQGFDSILTRDLALYSYGAQQAVEGVPPYVSVLNRAGPLAHLVPAVGVGAARIVGMDDILGMRLLMLLISVTCVWVLYALVRDLFHSRLAGVASATAMLTFAGFVTYAVGGPREKTTLTLFVLLVFWAVLKQRWLMAGICVALATLTWQPSFITGLLAAGVAVAGLGRTAMLPAALRFTVGGLIPTAVITAGFALAGAATAFLDGFVLINWRYTTPGRFYGFHDRVDLLTDAFGVSVVVILIGLVAIMVFAALRARDAFRSREAPDLAVVGIGVATVGGVLWSLFVFNGWADLMVLLPSAALGVGALAAEVQERVPGRVGMSILVGWSVVCLLAGLISSFENREHTLDRQRAEVDAMFAAVPPDATVLSVGGPEPLVLTHRTNPIRHQMFLAGLAQYVDDTWPGGLDGLAEWIGEEEPTFITVDHPEWYSWLEPTLDAEYVDVGTTPGDFTWYVHRSVGPDVVRELGRVTES